MKQLSIGIDGYNLSMPNGTGVATYGLALARTLQDAGQRVEGVFGLDVGADPALREVHFYDLLGREEPKNKTRRDIRKRFRRLFRDAARPFRHLRAYEVPITDLVEKSGYADRLPAFDRLVSVAHLFEIAHMHFDLYGRFLKIKMDRPPAIMHWTYPVPVELDGSRNIYTLHDLVPLRLPYTTLDKKQSYAAIVKQCVDRAAHICTVSEASRRDILAQWDVDPARVSNTYQASPLPLSALGQDAASDARMIEGIFGLPREGYFLFFGAIEPKKNLGRLLEAYLALQTETPLVIVGARAWQSEGELKLLPKGEASSNIYGRGVSSRIMRLDYLPRALLLRLIRSAKAVMFPSLYEGFGLPVLEALQLGTPVLTSNLASLPEVAGDAATFVNPYDVASISEGLRALDTDADLRTRLRQAGYIQAARFSQAAYASKLEQMYCSVLAER